MNYRYLFIILCFISCDKVSQKVNESESEETAKTQLCKEYVLELHDRNLEEVYKNQFNK